MDSSPSLLLRGSPRRPTLPALTALTAPAISEAPAKDPDPHTKDPSDGEISWRPNIGRHLAPTPGSAPAHDDWPTYSRSPNRPNNDTALPTTTPRLVNSPSSRPMPSLMLPAPYRQYPPSGSRPTIGPGPIMSNLQHPGMSVPQSTPQPERPFECDQCQRAFSRNHDLIRHKRIHLAVKCFPCKYCSKSFSRKDALRRHCLAKGCGKGSQPVKEEHKSDTDDIDLSTEDCKPGSSKDIDDDQLPPLKSLGRISHHLRLPAFAPPSTSAIQIPAVVTKIASLENVIDISAKPSHLRGSQEHNLENSSEQLEQPRHRVASQSPKSHRSSAVTGRYVKQRKIQIIDCVVFRVTQWLRSKFDARRRGGSYSSNGASGTPDTIRASHFKMKRASSKKPDNGKRKVTGREDSETDDDAGDGHKEDQQGSERTVHGDQKPKYACPYFKYNPAKYKHLRACPGPGWPNVHRVKDHLYRSHRQPKYRCGRCWQPFKDEQGYLEHQRTPEPCELQKMEYVEGFDAAQEQSLRSRKRANLEPSEAEKWKRVFTILFPHVLNDDIPSPFYEHNEMPQRPSGTQDSNSDYLAQCEDYMVKEVPQRLRQALGRELAQDLTIVEERLRRKAGECVKTLLEEVFQELRQKLRQVGSHAHGNSNARSKQSEVGDPLISVSESNPSEVSMLPPEGEYEAWLAGCGFDAADPLSLFGDAEICFHDGALLDNLMKSGGDGDGEGNKPLDSTYGSNSSG